jgi:hypothetical protein
MGYFRNYISLQEDRVINAHMTHVQDLVLHSGVRGVSQAIDALEGISEKLLGNSSSRIDISVKFDGAPALYCGEDPTDGSFFVAKKGIFNKNPKVYKSHADIDADTSGDLNKKLKVAFDELKDIGIRGVLQGDIMFSKGDVKKEKIDGVSYITFHPNTIVYAIPEDSPLAKEILRAKLGIVFHTTYTGSSFETLRASFGANIAGLKKKNSIWIRDAEYRDKTGKVTLSKKESDTVQGLISEAKKIFAKISRTTLTEIAKDSELAQTLEQYNNSLVRSGKPFPANSRTHVNGLIRWLNDRFSEEIAKRKTEKGKSVQIAKRDAFFKFFSQENIKNLELIFDLQRAIIDAKMIIITKLDSIKELDTFVKTKNGFKVTGSEGFVAIDRLRGGAVKLVDQLTFSHQNFSADILKNWMR